MVTMGQGRGNGNSSSVHVRKAGTNALPWGWVSRSLGFKGTFAHPGASHEGSRASGWCRDVREAHALVSLPTGLLSSDTKTRQAEAGLSSDTKMSYLLQS